MLAGLRSDLHLQDIPLILKLPFIYPNNELEAGSWEVPTQHTLSFQSDPSRVDIKLLRKKAVNIIGTVLLALLKVALLPQFWKNKL